MAKSKKLEEVYNRAKKLFEACQPKFTIKLHSYSGAMHVELSLKGEEHLSVNHLYAGSNKEVEQYLDGFYQASSIISDFK